MGKIRVEIEWDSNLHFDRGTLQAILERRYELDSFTVTKLPPETHAGEKKYCECGKDKNYQGHNGTCLYCGLGPKPAREKAGLPKLLITEWDDPMRNINNQMLAETINAIISYLSQKEDSHE